jgi:5'-nucleotidase (lipoprotein e(P4) family)
MKKIQLFFLAIILFGSISNTRVHATEEQLQPDCSLAEQNMKSVLWFQTSGEAKALFQQGYYLGKLRLDEIVKNKKKPVKKPAVVLDLDETVLDNSPYQAWSVLTGKAYPEKWDAWINQASAEPLPGALDFLHYADSKGVDIYYISNRKETFKKATIENLKKIGAPQSVADHIFLLQPGEEGKEDRRKEVEKTHDIILLLGDNLGDFRGFDGLSAAERVKAVEKNASLFGEKLIVFPNPIYGDWEGAIYNYDYEQSCQDKVKHQKEHLKVFQP